MQIGFLGSATSWYRHDLQRAAADDHIVTPVPFSQLASSLGDDRQFTATSGTIDLGQFDALLVRSMPLGSLEQVVFRMNVLARCEAAGMLVINPARSLEIAIDKYLCLAKLQTAGFDVPATFVCQTAEEALAGFARLGGDVVVKPIFGGEGRGIARVTDEAIAEHAFKLLAQNGAVLYLQQFIEHEGCDYRLLVIGEDVLGIKRHNRNDWRTNICLGAVAERLTITTQLSQMAQQAMTATGVCIGAVDLLPARDGKLYAIEVNAVPGWRALSRTLGVDVSRKVLEFVTNRTHAAD